MKLRHGAARTRGGRPLCPGPARRASGFLHLPHGPPSRAGTCLRAPGLLRPHVAGRGRGLTSPCSPCKGAHPCGPTAGWLGPRPGLMARLGIGTTQVHRAYASVRHPEWNPVGPERQDSTGPTWVPAPQPRLSDAHKVPVTPQGGSRSGKGRVRDLAWGSQTPPTQHLSRPGTEPSGAQGDRTVLRTQGSFLEEEGCRAAPLWHAALPQRGDPTSGHARHAQPLLVAGLNVLPAKMLSKLAQSRGPQSPQSGLPLRATPGAAVRADLPQTGSSYFLSAERGQGPQCPAKSKKQRTQSPDPMGAQGRVGRAPERGSGSAQGLGPELGGREACPRKALPGPLPTRNSPLQAAPLGLGGLAEPVQNRTTSVEPSRTGLRAGQGP